jgi:intracellular sulfur oxidation DsrE/DsrF family protein
MKLSWSRITLVALVLLIAIDSHASPRWPAAVAPVVKGTSGFVVIPHAAWPPSAKHVYRAVFDATQAASRPEDVSPAIDNAGSELNALGASQVPLANAKFVMVFHGDGVNAILSPASYRKKFGVANPNLSPIADMKRAGVKLFVCGQYLALAGIDPAALTPEVEVASDALIVLMQYQNDGYALLSF